MTKAERALAASIAASAQTTRPYPDVDDAMPLAGAYAVQQQVVERLQQRAPIAGYKAGLTNTAARQRFGANDAVSGVLLASGRLGNRATILTDVDDVLMIELEVGFVLARPVQAPLQPDDDPFALVASIAPVVELPNLNFAAPPALPDLIASNVSAQQFVIGTVRPLLAAVVLDALAVRLARDDVLVANGAGSATMAGQRDALRWLINHRLAQGNALKAGELLITGALTGMLPAQPGRYRAFFGALGSLEFSILAAQTPSVQAPSAALE